MNTISVAQYRTKMMMFSNELGATASSSNEETWPANRDALYTSWGLDPKDGEHITLSE